MNSEKAYNVLLQAWQENKEGKDYPSFDDINEALYIIKQDLKRKEKLEKAFVIIKIKKVKITLFLNAHSLEEYNAYCFEFNKLTQQEYDLIKEALQ